MKKKVVVIGAGPGGIMAAGKASSRGRDVILFEKNDRIGKKILISGKGRCNITNDTDIEGLIENTPGNGNFLYSAFYTFSNRDLIEFFEKLGLKTKVERGGRVFPVSDSAKDVNNVLLKYLKMNNVDLKLNSAVKEIKTKDNAVEAVVLRDGATVYCDSVVLATGGASYPGTGSTGDGYSMAKALGHTIVDLRPSLVPLITEEPWVKDLQGLTLKNVSIQIINNKGKKIYSDFGEMLFTHFGVSGPVILSASRHILDYNYKDVKLVIDLKPALSEEKLDERIIRDFEKYSRKQFKNSLDDLLPKKMIPVIVSLSGIEPDKFVNQIKKEERRNLVKLLKNLTVNIIGSRPIQEAIVTAGGVSTDEINPSTMESKIVKGLFFAGEVIDVDAYTGGFNLTIAFSTGYLAGMNC
ncbi:MAG TPA: NAD(P)/FAD-dependent oxidoreductase [Acetivibrio sp.]|jgi:predicted Rossmann fold flavoprotein|nr:NAD(P)/FAD-dependent oxidoreductase [Clostridium sp.]HOQ37386.1 NAD(P)/FAD-dependent oxidoreductase [Acetivibrio sp.]HPT91442.1 NAD(P)/FAD-dependent oxidoreductase [Acetivibrio sp.]HQA58051.1 NAD(P)/FAD-dependent oxidoreductase [Acetivibrio sp.]